LHINVSLCSIRWRGSMLVACNEEAFMKNDTQIQQDVLAELELDDSLEAGSIGVEVHHGVVKLAGRVGDAETKRRAIEDVRRVDGVTGIVLDMGTRRQL
jgi:osmotically-inducible protein OsmY